MNKKILIRLSIVLASIVAGIYILFLILPFITRPFFADLGTKLPAEIEKQTGFKTEFNNFTIITTPKFTVGARIDDVKIKTPDNKELLQAKNAAFKMSLLPLLVKKIEADVVSADSISADLHVKPNGHFKIEDFINEIAQKQEKPAETVNPEPFEMPLGLKFSDKLPDFRLKEYSITFIDDKTAKKYALTGLDTNVVDFVFNKKVKIQSKGKMVLDNFEAFNYDIKVLNKIMPETSLNDIITNPIETSDNQNNQEFNFDIIKAFESIKTNGIKANTVGDVKISGNIQNPELDGFVKIDGITMLSMGNKLPESVVNIDFAKNKHKFNIDFNTAKIENTKLTGYIQSGNKPKIDLTCKSNATLKSIFDIVNTMLLAFNIEDMKTLSANGRLDVDFNIKSDLKNVVSNGRIKLADGMVNYGLYGVKIENIISDISLDNNSVLINNVGFSTLGVPLTIKGKIKPDATLDIKVNTSNLSIKGLLVSLGQASILKENPINSGTATVSVDVTDKLDSPKIAGNISINNFNLKNIPSDIVLSFNPATIKLNNTKNGFEGTITANGVKAVNPALTVSAPVITAKLNEKQITISDTKTDIGKNQAAINGVISDYLTDKIVLDFNTKGKINSTLKGSLNPYKMTLNLNYSIPNNAEIIIPMFDKSKLITRGSVSVTGSMMNPILKGQFIIPSVSIPEVVVDIKNMVANLNGPILNGSALLDEFVSGGIKASDVKTDYKLAGNLFYLKNLMGKAFDGSFNGDIAYNIVSTDCAVKFKGQGMSALKAIEGAAGIKNAMTGTLKFNADVNFKGVEYDDMMKTLKGSADFDIENGILANLGGLKTLLNAQNIIQNALLKQTVEKTSKLAAIESASKFDNIKGAMTFSDSYATLKDIKLLGPSMAYFVTGKFNLISGSINAEILGRLSGDTVNLLGGLGGLAATKISNAIPAFGSVTASLAKSMSISPKSVDITKIPDLKKTDEKSKDFKAVFNIGNSSQAIVQTFKWIADVDTTALESASAANNVKSITEIKTETQNKINAAKQDVQTKAVETKKAIEDAKANIKTQAKDQARNYLKSLVAPPASSSQSAQ